MRRDREPSATDMTDESQRPFKRTHDEGGDTYYARRSASERYEQRVDGMALRTSRDEGMSPRPASARGGAHRRKVDVGRIVRRSIIVVVCIVVACICADIALTWGRVHRGVTVSGIDVGGMTVEEASCAIDEGLSNRAASATVVAVPDDDSFNRSLAVAQQDNPDLTAEGYVLQWNIDLNSVGATVDGESLAEQAYAVGRADSSTDVLADLGKIVSERWRAWFGGVALQATYDFDDELVASTCNEMDNYLAIPMVDYNIACADGVASVTEGNDGLTVDQTAIEAELTQAFLAGTDCSIVIPMATVPVDIDADEAQAVADEVNTDIGSDVTVTYDGQSWTVTPAMLGDWTTTTVTGSGDDAVMTPSIDTDKATSGLSDLLGSSVFKGAVDASFDVSSGTPVVVPSQTGTGPDLATGAAQLDALVFGGTGAQAATTTTTAATAITASTTAAAAGTTHTIALQYADVDPAITTEDAQGMGVTQLLASYTLSYGSNSGSNREHNIELALSMFNGTLVAPGDSWSWVEDMGACDYSDGFLAAGAIGSDGSTVQEAGGGICNVATGLFNAIYEAGLEIDERHNHSEYLSNYPLGRDCTVSYPGVTFTWTNDTSHYVLITDTYDGYNMVISIWGTSDGRTVTSKTSDWSGSTITNYRTVTAADGSVLHDDVFTSYFKYM